MLVDHALARFSTDNLSCMVVRFDKQQLLENQQNNTIGVEGDAATSTGTGKLTEAEKIVTATRQKIAEGAAPAVGISASNSGKGHDPVPPANTTGEDEASSNFTPTMIEGPVEEEPASYESTERTSDGSVEKMDIDSPAKS